MMRIITAIVLITLVACQDSDEQASGGREAIRQNLSSASLTAEPRWYRQDQVSTGQEVFAQNCAVCHGDRAQGLVENWRQRLPDGSFPPPPLNGSAHAWHHPLFQLIQTIETGGVPYGGQMPAFDELLSNEEKLAAVAYFQDFWDEEIYLSWVDRGGLD